MMVKRVLDQEGPLRVVVGVVLFAAALLTFLFAGVLSPEPFENAGDGNSLGGVLATIQRVSGTLLQPSTWTDRIDMYKMSPVELARRYLKSQAKEEDAEE